MPASPNMNFTCSNFCVIIYTITLSLAIREQRISQMNIS